MCYKETNAAFKFKYNCYCVVWAASQHSFVTEYHNNVSIFYIQGPYTREDGFLGYNEICLQQMQDSGPGQSWTVNWDPYYQAPYMYRSDIILHM